MDKPFFATEQNQKDNHIFCLLLAAFVFILLTSFFNKCNSNFAAYNNQSRVMIDSPRQQERRQEREAFQREAERFQRALERIDK